MVGKNVVFEVFAIYNNQCHYLPQQAVSEDSLVDCPSEDYLVQDSPAVQPVVVKNKEQRRVSIAETEEQQEVATAAAEDEVDLPDTAPRLPSVRDLATRFQPKASPEPKPRKSLMKVIQTRMLPSFSSPILPRRYCI